jgi:predicted nucleotidyltransferase
MNSLDDITLDLVEFLEARSIPYALMGGLAVRIHAVPRATYDVDFTISIARSELPNLYASVKELGYTVPAAQEAGWIDEVQGLPVIKLQLFVAGHVLDVDMFLAETAYQRELLSRRQRHRADGFEAWFVSPEDLVLLKLLAGRPKDYVDVADVLFIQGELDLSYLRLWAGWLGILESLDQALRSI